ncbi:MAG: hypothetical protein J7647_13545 [Cyanobacteria bacterium SBLK]|nr:hypothetical protein [Cyanobacteria bacterium SBLK]
MLVQTLAPNEEKWLAALSRDCISECDRVVIEVARFVIPDTATDSRFADNSPILADCRRRYLADWRNCPTFLEDFPTLTPSLMLLEINIPRMNGSEFCAIVKADPISVKFPQLF